METNKETICLLGCGWLGFPLAVSLISRGFPIKASTTSPAKLPMLKSAGVDPFLVQFSSLKPDPDLSQVLKADTLIVSIPPARKHTDGAESYRKMAEILRGLLPDSSISTLIFISSTSVYADTNSVVDEGTRVMPDSASGKLMTEVEMIFSSLPLKVIILRLAGLIGPGRMPGRFFAGKSNIPNGAAPVNLVHLDDVIGAIHRVLDDPEASGVYNVCAPSHPPKQEFYTEAAKQEGLELPHFIPEASGWKIISCDRLQNELNYKFKFPSLLDWLNQT